MEPQSEGKAPSAVDVAVPTTTEPVTIPLTFKDPNFTVKGTHFLRHFNVTKFNK